MALPRYDEESYRQFGLGIRHAVGISIGLWAIILGAIFSKPVMIAGLVLTPLACLVFMWLTPERPVPQYQSDGTLKRPQDSLQRTGRP
jgi:hypothetical protein